jgi:50S ribosomal protein L16 3-hydroxylase
MTDSEPDVLNLDREDFLARYWQRKPLFIPRAIADFKPPISPHQLEGLALEEGIESRIIEYRNKQWLLHHGPFQRSDYARRNPWTLLVQAVDHFIPEVAELRKLVDFLPLWRVDDVMVSYAPDGGSVGPHFDNYDVFLLQGIGQRRWKIGPFCEADAGLLPHDELRLLQEFVVEQEFLLNTGDMLYLPPGIAHWGIAVGECTTFSIGFRAPRVTDMVARFIDQLLEQLEPDQFYHDAMQVPTSRAGELRPRDLERAMAQLQGALDQASGNQWFGELVTEPRYEAYPDDDDLAEARHLLQDGPKFVALSPAAKLAWQQEAAGIRVFANGESRCFDNSVLPGLIVLCEHWRLEGGPLESALNIDAGVELLDYLLETGCLYVE